MLGIIQIPRVVIFTTHYSEVVINVVKEIFGSVLTS